MNLPKRRMAVEEHPVITKAKGIALLAILIALPTIYVVKKTQDAIRQAEQ